MEMTEEIKLVPSLEQLIAKMRDLHVSAPGWYGEQDGTHNHFSSDFYIRTGNKYKYGLGKFSKTCSWVGSWENGTTEDTCGARYWIIDRSKNKYRAIEHVLHQDVSYSGHVSEKATMESVYITSGFNHLHRYLKRSLDAIPTIDAVRARYQMVTKDPATE